MAPGRAVWVLTRATLPALPLRLMPPSRSGVNVAPVAPPLAPPTTNFPPAGMVPLRLVLVVQLLPAAEGYCTDQPARSTGAVVLLTSSMKSRLNAAPELPPPP